MGVYLNPGNEKFQKALRSKIYVDKTGMLDYTNSMINTEQCQICVSRPRRFGKSIAANMLAAYYSKGCDSKNIFCDLSIAELSDYKKHLNQYNVIKLDMNDFRFRKDSETGERVTAIKTVQLVQIEIIKELGEQFLGIDLGTDEDLPLALTNVNKFCGEQFIIIIDEWDTIFREDKEDTEAQKQYIELFRGLFKNSNSQNFLALAYITGILPIKKYGTQSALNNFREFTMINPKVLAEYVGFTEKEVQRLCQEYEMDFEEARKWYDGYSFRRVQHIYSPNSVINAMLDAEFDNYWTRTETYESLKYYITMNFNGLKDAVVQMIAGARCKVNPDKFQNDMTSFESRDDILTLLVHLGYLAYDFKEKQVYIPNEEVRSEFRNAIEGAGWDAVIKAISASEGILQATWRGDEKAVAEGIEQVHMSNTSILSYNDENSLSCIISLAYYCAINEYTLIREFPTGKGYADVVFLPRCHSAKPAMVVELKWNKSAEGAIKQIRERRYISALEEYQGNILLVGINYDEKTKIHQCCIEKMCF